MIKTTPFALVAALALGACAQPNTSASIAPGTTVYAGSEVGRAMSTTENCRIAGVRQVVINGDSAADQRQANARRTTGTLLGGATGAVIGNQIGGGSGKKAATVIGAIVGASVGQ
ncbi:MAG: glycine zipper 2TM domain-containing protein, partial [Erythrobacter sp.]